MLQNFQTGSGNHPASYPVGTRASSARSKAAGGVKVTARLPSSAEVKNEWSYTSTALICLHGVDRDSCNFYI
jgi:hypothetical protein